MTHRSATAFPPPIVKGDDYILDLVFYVERHPRAPYAVTGMTFTSQLRTTPEAASAVANFTVTPHPTLTNAVTLSIPYAETTALAAGEYFWDVQVVSGTGERSTLFVGHKIDVVWDVTR